MCAQNRMTGEQAEKRMELLKEMFARYAEIDGGPYIMEMMKQLNEDTLLDSDDCEKLMGRLTIYNEKLYRDALTGAYNRRFYEDEVRGMKERAGVAVIDLDDFKLYNDTYGHHAGDMVLETVADIIRNFIRKSDMLIRCGGDEFLLILPGIRPDAFSSKLQLIQERIHAASVPGYHHLQISVSIGGVMFDGGDISEALSRADTLMYQAKVQKNMVVTGWEARKAEKDVIRDTRQQILIVDDSEMNRAILTEILKKDYRYSGGGERRRMYPDSAAVRHRHFPGAAGSRHARSMDGFRACCHVMNSGGSGSMIFRSS